MGLLDVAKKAVKQAVSAATVTELEKQVAAAERERETVEAAPALAPETLGGKKRKYHYKDIAIWITWEYSGQYGKSCESIGMKRGDPVSLVPEPAENDMEAISVYWKGKRIGAMKSNRLRGMVRAWMTDGLPVFCAVSSVGGQSRLMLEFAFYGYSRK